MFSAQQTEPDDSEGVHVMLFSLLSSLHPLPFSPIYIGISKTVCGRWNYFSQFLNLEATQ
jgi:hypothetical protein